jgi:GAF domain-containing protein
MIRPDAAKAFLNDLDRDLPASPDAAATAVRLIARHFEHYHWIGIYWLTDGELALGPYVGAATEHTRIAIGQGVCGTAVAQGKNQVISDVRQVENYLACSLKTRAEIVVLLRRDGAILGQIDADSDKVGAFDSTDEELLAQVAERLIPLLSSRR